MKKLHLSAILAPWLIVSPSAANVLQPVSLRDQYARADVVILVRAGQNSLCNVDSAMVPCVELAEPLYLKGNNDHLGRTRYVITHSRIRELAVDCCDPGSTYLMFLRTYRNNLFPVIGHWSIIRIDRSDDLPIN